MSRGFTLIELMLVIGILSVLLAITLVAINPQRQFSKANDTKRGSDVLAILNAVGEYSANNHGAIPPVIPTGSPIAIGNGAGQINLCSALVPTYIAALPVDPQTTGSKEITDCSSSYSINYWISQTSSGRVTVIAPNSQLIPTITATR